MAELNTVTATPSGVGALAQPSGRVNSETARQLVWSLQRLAAAAGRSLDRLQLHQALQNFEPALAPQAQAQWLCEQLGWPVPAAADAPDPAQLPLLAHQATTGWMIVVGRNADGSWLAHAPAGPQQLQLGAEVLLLRLLAPPASITRQRARDMISTAFWRYKPIFLDGALAPC